MVEWNDLRSNEMYVQQSCQVLGLASHIGIFFPFWVLLPLFMEKWCENANKMILISKQSAKHPFACQNTQQLVTFLKYLFDMLHINIKSSKFEMGDGWCSLF